MSRLVKNFFQYFSHFTPIGSPRFLISFIKIIEVISKVIRPLTLGVRLAVNLLTGHLLLRMFRKLHTSNLIKRKLLMMVVLYFFGIFIFFYESCICVIQALVYRLLIKNYFDEHSN